MSNFLFTYTDQFYTPEAILSSWSNLSVLILTTSMVFYHLTRHNSIKVEKHLAAFIAIALLLTGMVYLILTLRNYIPRINDVITKCKTDKRCDSIQLNRIKETQRVNVIVTMLMIMIEMVIGYLIFNTL
jgi:hypothetical protein